MTNNDLRAIDAPLRDLTDNALARPLPAGLVGAREDIIAAAHDLLAIPESSLASDWPMWSRPQELAGILGDVAKEHSAPR